MGLNPVSYVINLAKTSNSAAARLFAEGHALHSSGSFSHGAQPRTRSIDGFVLEREVVIATVSGSTATIEIRRITQLAA